MIEGIDQRLIVVGAGPVGLYFSYLVKKKNPNLYVVVLDRNKSVNFTSCCTGLISIKTFNRLKLSNLIKTKDFVLNTINSAHIFAPYKTELNINANESKAYVIDRVRFSSKIMDLALSVGVDIRFSNNVIKLDKNEVIVNDIIKKEKYNLRYDVIVGADGPESIVRNSKFIKISKIDFIHAYQVKVEGSFDKEKVNLYFGDFAKGLFAWLVPESKTVARIGVGTYLGRNPKESFYNFKDKFKINYNNLLNECSGIIPISKELDSYSQENSLIIGDAACMVKATTGGGINFGLMSAEIAEKTITDRFKRFKKLKNFDKLFEKYNRELRLHYKIHKYINSKTNIELDELILKLKNLGIEKFLEDYGNMDFPSSFLPKFILKFKFISLIKEVINLIKS